MDQYKFAKKIRGEDGNLEDFTFKAFKINKIFLAHKQKMLWIICGDNENGPVNYELYGVVNQEFIDGLCPEVGDYYCQHVDGADWIVRNPEQKANALNEFTCKIKSGKIKEIT